MGTKTHNRMGLWLGVAVVGTVLAATALVGTDDEAQRGYENNERRREVLFEADWDSGIVEESTVRWGLRGSLDDVDNPKLPFRRVREAQTGDRAVLIVRLKQFDGSVRCAVTVNGRRHAGRHYGFGCEVGVMV